MYDNNKHYHLCYFLDITQQMFYLNLYFNNLNIIELNFQKKLTAGLLNVYSLYSQNMLAPLYACEYFECLW